MIMPCRANQDIWVMMESLDKMWSTGEGNGKLLQHSCLENPMNSMKRQIDRRGIVVIPAEPLPQALVSTLTDSWWQVKIYMLNEGQQ